MAIDTNTTIHAFGTEDEVTVASPNAVNAGAFSVTEDVNDWTNDDDAVFAMFKLKVTSAGWGGAPSAGEVVNLYARLMNIEGTEDNPVPDANFKMTFMGAFVVDAVDADQVLTLGPVGLPNYITSQVYEFYIENDTSVAIGATGWQLWVSPMGIKPHP